MTRITLEEALQGRQFLTCVTHEADGDGKCAYCNRELHKKIGGKPVEKGDRIGIILSRLTGGIAYRVGVNDSNMRCVRL